MPDFRYVICDVFTDRPLEGNPLAVFTDAGNARDDGEAARRLSSWGVGLRWAPAPGLLAQVYKGFARQKIGDLTPTRTLADRGIHFLVAAQMLF